MLKPPLDAPAERPFASEAKGSINLRIETNTRRLIDEAATVLGKTRTEFMVESARRQAIDVTVSPPVPWSAPPLPERSGATRPTRFRFR